MIWQGMKCISKEQLRELRDYINTCLRSRYKPIEIVDDRECFLLDTGEILSITCMFGENVNALVTEFADSIDDMKNYSTTDGDLYPLEDYDSPEQLLKAIIDEIEE